MKQFSIALWQVASLCTAMIGYHIHGSLFWAFMDYVFTLFAWAKWLVCQQVTLSIIRDTFSFFWK